MTAAVSRQTPLHDGPIEHQDLIRIPLELIDPSPLNPRQTFDEATLDQLAASLASDGQLQPIVLRPIGTGKDLRYSIVAGERRYRAAKRLGWRTIATVVRPELTEQSHARIALIENLERADLDPLEEARGYQQLLDLGMTQEQVADAVHRSRPAIANSLRLLKAPEAVRAKMRQVGPDGKPSLSPSHVLALLRLEAFPDAMVRAAEVAADKRIPTKQLDGDLPYEITGALTEGGKLAVDLFRAEFDRGKVCGQCPFGARLKGRYGEYCLKPEHFRQLQKEHRAKERAKVEKQLEKAADAGPGQKVTLKLNSLKHGQYEQIYTAPEGCSTACECRSRAIGYGKQVVEICQKPAEYHRKQQAQRDRAEARRRDSAEDLSKRCGARLEQVSDIGSRELAVLVAEVIQGIRDGKWIDQLMAKHAPGFTFNEKTGFDDLASLQPLQLLKIAVEAALAQQILELKRWEGADVEIAAWYAAEPRPPKPKRGKKAAAAPPTFDADAHIATEIAADAERLAAEFEFAGAVQ